MAVSNPRYRVVTFRLSSGEYESVYAAAESRGARSISDFARGAVLERVSKPGNDDREQLRLLSERSEQVVRLLNDLDRRLGEVCNSGKKEATCGE